MAGITTAWRLSEPGWRDELDSITVYQRGWRLGGKGASSRGAHGRIEEHGLHLWLGYYENAFRVLRECYAELDREVTDPTARLRTWREAMLPTEDVGLEHAGLGGWQHWVGRFTPNDELPGDPGEPGAGVTVVDYVRRALRLVADFLESLTVESERRGGSSAATATATLLAGAPIVALAGILEATAQLGSVRTPAGLEGIVRGLDRALRSVRTSVRELADEDADVLRTWHLVSVMTASVRGVLADGLLTHPDGFRAANDEDFVDWILRHGAAPEVAEFAFIRGLYDLVFADLGAERATRGVAAGTAVFMTSKMFFEYKGAIFWKMAAGMGDVVFAPMYEALRRRGVDFEFFHRVDQLHVGADGLHIDSITLGRQAALAADCARYEPLVRVGDLPGFPAAPLGDQLCDPDRLAGQDLESHWCQVPDVEERVLRRGAEFDDVVLAIPVGMAALVCEELVAARPEWARMTERLATTATQALQLWLRPAEPELGWRFPGATVSAYAQPFNTWASMDQLTAIECWPDDDRPGTIAYFCGALDAPAAPASDATFPERQRARVAEHALSFVERDLVHLLPGAAESGRVRWDQLCGAGGASGPAALATQYVAANVDPSDRYVQCAPGTDRVRLRADESGFDNLFLAGDWTDNGLNAGCIEAATLSGLQAANAVLGRSRSHRIAGRYLG